MTRIEAVLFDVDGTLLNSIDFIVDAYAHTARTHGFAEVTRAMVIEMGGKGLEECYAVFAPGYDTVPLARTHRKFQQENTLLAAPYPAAVNVLAAIRDQGRKTGAVTSRRTTAPRTLEESGLMPYLDVVVTGDDVDRIKPHPEGVQRALAHLGVDPRAAVMVGDTVSDIIAARVAGLRTIGVTYGFFNAEDFAANPPDRIIGDLSELPALLDMMDTAGV
jgi:pyrophosphatase PpaX